MTIDAIRGYWATLQLMALPRLVLPRVIVFDEPHLMQIG